MSQYKLFPTGTNGQSAASDDSEQPITRSIQAESRDVVENVSSRQGLYQNL